MVSGKEVREFGKIELLVSTQKEVLGSRTELPCCTQGGVRFYNISLVMYIQVEEACM